MGRGGALGGKGKGKPALGQGPVVTEKAGTQVWLVKVPKFLAEQWRAAGTQGGEELGRVEVTAAAAGAGGGGESRLELRLGEGHPFGEIPDRYSMLPASGQQGMCMHPIQTQHGRLSVNGRVTASYTTQPQRQVGALGVRVDSKYSKISRLRLEREEQASKAKVAQVIQDTGAVAAKKEAILPANYVGKGQRLHELGLRASDNRRVREQDRSKVIDLILTLFERKDAWRFDDLVQETKQPAAYLRELLQEVCDYTKSGANLGTWSIKAKYRF